jgi:hypothetical protein
MEDAMDDLTRRRALKLAASTGAAAVGVAVVGGPEARAQQARKPGPNDGTPVDDGPAPDIPSGQYGYAVVDASGMLVRGHHAVSSAPLGTGEYQVIFDSNVRGGAYIASIGLPGSLGASPPGQISVVGRFNNVNGVFIETTDSSGNLADLGFHLAVLT